MNYRHAFHAGNFADVMKHAIFVRVLLALQRKDTPVRIIDTHAGIGLYRLDGDEATRGGEAAAGIGRLLGPDAVTVDAAPAALLAPYLKAVAAHNPEHGPAAPVTRYPGSPLIARHLMRAQDRLIVNELHPVDGRQLAETFEGDRLVRVLSEDGWHVVRSQLPPLERRAIVLIDPPFEKRGEFDRLAQALDDGVKRFATAVYLLWYPIKDMKAVARFHRQLIDAGHTRLIAAELTLQGPVKHQRHDPPLLGAGLVILNPPYGLDDELRVMMPALARALSVAPGGAGRVVTLAGEPSD